MSEQRMRGRKLQALRHRMLSAEPICRICTAAGRVSAATVLDHIQPLAAGGSNQPSNLQPLCRPCHDVKSADDVARIMGRKVKPTFGLDGWPV